MRCGGFRPVWLVVVAVLAAGCGAKGSGVVLETLPSESMVSSSVVVSVTSTISSLPVPVTSSVSVLSSVVSSVSVSPQVREAADRAEVERLWREWKSLTIKLPGMDAGAQRRLLATHATPRLIQRAIDGAARHHAQKTGTYGSETITHVFSWPEPINGGNSVVFRVCVDNSKFGTYDLVTGKKLTKGTKTSPARVRAVRTPHGWRLDAFSWLGGQTC